MTDNPILSFCPFHLGKAPFLAVGGLTKLYQLFTFKLNTKDRIWQSRILEFFAVFSSPPFLPPGRVYPFTSLHWSIPCVLFLSFSHFISLLCFSLLRFFLLPPSTPCLLTTSYGILPGVAVIWSPLLCRSGNLLLLANLANVLLYVCNSQKLTCGMLVRNEP